MVGASEERLKSNSFLSRVNKKKRTYLSMALEVTRKQKIALYREC